MDTEQLKKYLVSSNKPVKVVLSPFFQASIVFLSSLSFLFMLILFMGLREDFSFIKNAGHFIFLSISIVGINFFSSLACVKASIPGDSYRLELVAILLLLLTSLCLIYSKYSDSSILVNEPDYYCAFFIAALTVSLFLFYRNFLAKNYILDPKVIFSISVLCASSFGFLGINFLCHNDARLHLLTWHYLPVLIIPGLVWVTLSVKELIFKN